MYLVKGLVRNIYSVNGGYHFTDVDGENVVLSWSFLFSPTPSSMEAEIQLHPAQWSPNPLLPRACADSFSPHPRPQEDSSDHTSSPRLSLNSPGPT